MKTPEKWRGYFLELQKADVLKRISEREAALLLIALSKIPRAEMACDTLIVKLRGKAWSWVEDKELLDSALIILAVYNYRQTEIDGVCLAYLTNKMLKSEVEVGGPYNNNRQETDYLTNFVISKLFKLLGSPLPNVDRFLKQYESPTFIQADAGTIYNVLLDTGKPSFSKNTIKEAAQAMPFLAKALTYKKPSKNVSSGSWPVYQIVSETIYKEIQEMSNPIKDHAVTVWEMVNKSDVNHEITEISKYFAHSLLHRPESLGQKIDVKLGTANFYTWMAYTIYDDLIDEEGQTYLLPVANSMLRKALAAYVQFSHGSSALLKEMFESFDKMDAANSWELAHCRYEVKDGKIKIARLPAYSNYHILANRAKGHILGPMMIIYSLQTTVAQRMNIQKGLEHFLIAKQLGDDLYDWASDFQKGHINAVVAYLLKSMKVMPGWYSLPQLIKRMREYFWSDGVKEVNETILKHLAYSKHCFKKSGLLDLNGEFFLYIFNPLEESARDNKLKNIHQQQFLENFINQ